MFESYNPLYDIYEKFDIEAKIEEELLQLIECAVKEYMDTCSAQSIKTLLTYVAQR